MVRAVRAGQSLRVVATAFGVSVGTVAYWVAHARGKRLDRVRFDNQTPGRAWNRTDATVEQRILSVRSALRQHSVLGEYGLDAIRSALREDDSVPQLPGRTTIYRVLARHGVLDGAHRLRRPAPPKGWYLPALATGDAELDTFDFIEDLKIANGPMISVLTGTSLHGGLADAWVMPQPRTLATLDALLERWRRDGLPTYAQFDNGTIFQGAHQFPDTVGRISRVCLALGVVPVFATPREHGFQNAIEGFNSLWQSKVWRRFRFPDVASVAAASARYIAAYRTKTASRQETVQRRRFPRRFKLNLRAPLNGTIIYLRRSNDRGNVDLLGRRFLVDQHWCHRLVRCEVDFTHQHIRFYALRRSAPDSQPMLRELPYRRPNKPFQGKQ
jgi:hypothetical protein